MAEFEFVRYAQHDGVATIELARPDKLNAINAQMFSELGQAAGRAADDPGIRVVLVKGEGRAFCAGIDVSVLGQLHGTRGARFMTFVRTAQRPFLLLSQMDKPTVAAVHGHAIGAGFQLALACDLRLAADDASFAMFEVRYGLVPDLGGTHRLARLIGPSRAQELVWTGRNVDAEEADRLGIVNRIVPADGLAKEAETLAREIAASPPIPVSLVKSLVGRSPETPYETMLEHAAQAQAACVETEDHREAVEAYLEKRPPRFQGK